MSTAQILALGAVAGLTIFIGLPIGRMHGLDAWLKCFLSSTATGILLFLLWDVLSAAVDPVETALTAGRDGRFLWLATLLTVGRARRAQPRARPDHRLRPAQRDRGLRDRRAARDRAPGAELGLSRPAWADRRRAHLLRHRARTGVGERGPVHRGPGTCGRVDPLRRDGAPECQPRLRVEDGGDARDPARARARLRDGLRARRGGRVRLRR